MTTRVEGGLTYTQTFDAENRLISVAVSGQTTQFIYNGDGNLVKKIKPDGSKTIYVGGIYEVDKTSGGSVTRTVTYYPVAGAMRINSTLYYVLKDHLGSASVVTDASGNILGEQRYYPFGETRVTTGTIYTDRLFTGQREMAGLGIYHFNARFYSPKLGRFLSADTIVPGYANPQSLNRFSYVRNNPLRYIDPTGHWEVDGCAQNCENTFTSGCGGAGQQSCGGVSGNSSNDGGNDGGGGGGGCVPPPGQWLCDLDALADPSSHYYTLTNMVCAAELHCTEDEMRFYLSLYAYPGQVGFVEDSHPYWVSPFNLFPEWPWFYSGGAIIVDVSNGGLTSTNISQRSHIFHDGTVVRELSQDMDGNWFVTTTGSGANDTPVIGLFIDVFNDVVGPPAFENLDTQMASSIAAHHGTIP